LALPGHQSERRKRFYKAVTVAETERGFAVQLDGRTARSPGGAPLLLPTQALAALVAEEWAAQTTDIEPATMPATQLASAALGVDASGRTAAAERLASFAGSDLLCYFADWPAGLVEQQTRRWGPAIDWAEATLQVSFHRAQGIVHQPQPQATLNRIAERAVAEDNFTLAGLLAAAALFGSAILAFAVRHGQLTADAAFALSRLDETFQEERWGVDAEAAARTDTMAKEAVMLGQWFEALGRH
jgi:chaperone required for assembly of F1-ATPase